ncbi:MAG: protein kinase [Chloroflexi bacterium]|nr:protein kinase [Chloroflexota bacterium]
MDLIGKTLGQYEIIEAIGRSGMASVFKAYQSALDRFVAVKVLSPQRASQENFSERFVREARAIAALNHPNILPIIDFGQQDEHTYIVMKYVPGGTLSDRLKQPIDLLTTTRLIKQVAAALDHAHSRGIIHRDVKPSNVLLDDNEWAQLADFGLAKIMASDQLLTSSGISLGTPAYIAPEQGQGEPLDHHADIYSLGVILFEMTTGRLPFTAETAMGVMVKHIYDAPPLPHSIKPDLPEALEAIILKALAKPIGERYHTAGELAYALEMAVLQLPAQQILTTHLEDPNATPRYGPTPARVTPVTPLSRKQLMEETAPTVPHFIGRQAELAAYRARLERDHFVIVTGMAGMGKTTLGAKLARTVADTSDNIFWFTFDQVEKSTADALYWALASFLDSRGEPNLWTYLQGEIGAQKPLERMAKLNLLMASLASGDHVLCFDDFQVAAHLPDIAYIFKTIRQRFVDLHQDLPARIIIMGRELSPDMEYLVSEPLTGLSDAETAAFVADRQVALSADLIKQLWTRTEGNPKLLELSVSALTTMRPSNQEHFVSSLARKGDIRDYVMNNVYTALTLEEQTVMGALSVFAGAIEREGAEDILSTAGVSSVAPRIDALINKHVISETDEYLHLHSLVRDYCYHLLNRHERLHYHQLAAEYFETERNYLSAAHHHFEQKAYGTALNLLSGRSQAIINAGGGGNLLEQLNRFQRENLSAEQRATLDKAKGDCHRLRGEYQVAIQAYESAFSTATDDVARAEMQQSISNVYLKAGEFPQALQHARQSLALGEAANNQSAVAHAQHDIAAALYQLGDLDAASAELAASERVAHSLHDRLLVANINLGLGLIAWKRRHLAAARDHFEVSRRIFHEFDQRRGEANALGNLGLIAGELQEADRQITYYRQALAAYETIGDVDALCAGYNNLGYVYLTQNDYAQAIDYYERLASTSQATGNRRLQVYAHAGLADAWRARADLAVALNHARQSCSIAQRLGADAELGLSYRVLGDVQLDLKEGVQARQAFEQSIARLSQAQDDVELNKALRGYESAQAYLANSQPSQLTGE